MTDGGNPEKAIPDLILELAGRLPGSRQNGTILIRNRDLTVAIWEEGYVFRFDTLKNIYEIWMKEDGSYARIYYRCPINEEEQDSLFLAIRPVFLFLAQRRGMFALHSASLLYLEKAWLFSVPSGMGKSTHTALWKKLFATPFLNGDLNHKSEKRRNSLSMASRGAEHQKSLRRRKKSWVELYCWKRRRRKNWFL